MTKAYLNGMFKFYESERHTGNTLNILQQSLLNTAITLRLMIQNNYYAFLTNFKYIRTITANVKIKL